MITCKRRRKACTQLANAPSTAAFATLVAPLFEQGAVLAKQLCGVQTKPYEGTQLSTKLKISGVECIFDGRLPGSARADGDSQAG